MALLTCVEFNTVKAYSNPIPSPASLNKPIAHVIPSTGSRITRPRTTRLRENRRHLLQRPEGTYMEPSALTCWHARWRTIGGMEEEKEGYSWVRHVEARMSHPLTELHWDHPLTSLTCKLDKYRKDGVRGTSGVNCIARPVGGSISATNRAFASCVSLLCLRRNSTTATRTLTAKLTCEQDASPQDTGFTADSSNYTAVCFLFRKSEIQNCTGLKLALVVPAEISQEQSTSCWEKNTCSILPARRERK